MFLLYTKNNINYSLTHDNDKNLKFNFLILFFLENIIKSYPKYIKKIYIYNNDFKFINIQLHNNNDLYLFLNLLIKFYKFNILNDIITVDFLLKKNLERFESNYIMSSIYYNIYLNIIIYTNGIVNTITNLLKNSNWLERENWDMFGITYNGNLDLRRIFTDYGFNGFPLRKDFPLTGFLELRYDDEFKSIVYEPVELSQEYRNFIFLNPWDFYQNN